jgi:negative regulator of flagellin synthesis FlgM
MVDPVGSRPVTSIGQRAIAPADATTRVAATTTATTNAPSGGLARGGTVAASLSASPPVDTDRVATIRKAIEEGRFPLSPATIADNMIALKLNWVRNEPA